MAVAALSGRPLAPLGGPLAVTLDAAAALFDAQLFFEAHELLEPCWRDARGERRAALQGLIQIAVGFQHVANGNLAGGRALLVEGAERISRGRVEDLAMAPFARAVLAAAEAPDPAAAAVPPFPRPG
jgi:hypothetical protein